MLGEFLARLAVALPLVCALAALTLLAVKRGWLALPSLPTLSLPGLSLPGLSLPGFARRRSGSATAPAIDLVEMRSLTPTTRLAVVRFAGREHLIAFAGQSLLLVASTAEPEPLPPSEEPTRWTS
ncbi:MAG: flagellar biosynthetic protein FliO [Sandaracinobacteroides sp.]